MKIESCRHDLSTIDVDCQSSTLPNTLARILSLTWIVERIWNIPFRNSILESPSHTRNLLAVLCPTPEEISTGVSLKDFELRLDVFPDVSDHVVGPALHVHSSVGGRVEVTYVD